MTEFEHSLERTVLICARRATVFRYFTDSERFAAWWGAGSRIEARPGGTVYIRFTGGSVATGEVLEVVPERRIVFSYGFEEGKPIPLGGSRVTITLEEQPGGTLVRLRHELQDAGARDVFVQGWRYQLAVFANVVAREQHAGLSAAVDRFFGAWAEKDAGKRSAELAAIAAPDVSFQDLYSCTRGIDDLAAHLAGFQVHMPVVLERQGEVRQCQGTAVVDWVARTADGGTKGRGTNVFDLGPDGRITRVVGLWA